MSNRYSRISLAIVVATAASLSWGAKICIDAGHGGSDPGAVGSGQQEKANVLDCCNKFKSWLDLDNGDGGGGGSWTNVRTRTSDVYVSLQGRCDISNANGADRFMSTHNNACCGASGTETFSWSSTGTGANLRNNVQSRSVQAW